jgi:hypothetical protein
VDGRAGTAAERVALTRHHGAAKPYAPRVPLNDRERTLLDHAAKAVPRPQTVAAVLRSRLQRGFHIAGRLLAVVKKTLYTSILANRNQMWSSHP